MRSEKGLKAVLKEVAIIFSAVSIIALLFNQFRPNGLSLVRDWPYQAYSANLLNVSLDEAIREFEEGRVIFVDARSWERYQEGHIPRALNIPYDSFYDKLPAVKEKISSDARIITYCEEKEFSFSEDLAALLQDTGFKDVRVFLAGWSQWMEAGLPIEWNTTSK